MASFVVMGGEDTKEQNWVNIYYSWVFAVSGGKKTNLSLPESVAREKVLLVSTWKRICPLVPYKDID